MNYGPQEVIIAGAVISESRQKGTPYVGITATTIPDGEVVDIPIYITPNSANMAHAQLKACGFDSDVQSLNELAQNPTLLRGNKVMVSIREEIYNGKQQLRVEIMLGKPIGNERLGALDALLQGRPKAGSPPPQAEPLSPLPTDKKDMPF